MHTDNSHALRRAASEQLEKSIGTRMVFFVDFSAKSISPSTVLLDLNRGDNV